MLLAIVWANLTYCLVSGFLILFFERITIWGQALLLFEVIVIVLIVAVELSVYSRIRL